MLGGVGGFAGLFDLSFAKDYAKPLLATSTDGVGTKIAIAQALDRHDTIGQDLVGMVVDDIVVVGAKPLFMTDYIACGKVVPERIAAIVTGIARACADTGTALVGGETAEHPGLMGADDYDVAGAAVGIVEADRLLGAERVSDGDVVIAIESSGLHSNGYSLVRSILRQAKIDFVDRSDDLSTTWGEALLEPTRLYTGPLVQLLAGRRRRGALAVARHGRRHRGEPRPRAPARIVGRTRPVDLVAGPVFRVLNDLAGTTLESTEGTWNLGIGFFAVVAAEAAASVIAALGSLGLPAWPAGTVTIGDRRSRRLRAGRQGRRRRRGAARRRLRELSGASPVSAAVSIGIIGTTPPEVVRALAPRIERLGFARLWINDVPGGDSLAGLRVAAEATSSLGLATGVIPLDRRPVDSLDLGGLPAERLTLGIGSGRVAIRPVDFVREGLAALRDVSDAPIVVGALGPRMRRLAAEQADGVLLNWLTPAAGGDTARELRRDAGERSVRSTLYVRTIADEVARPVLEREVARYETVPAYVANFDRLGFRPADATITDAGRLAEYVDVRPRRDRASRDHVLELARRTRAVRRGRLPHGGLARSSA